MKQELKQKVQKRGWGSQNRKETQKIEIEKIKFQIEKEPKEYGKKYA